MGSNLAKIRRDGVYGTQSNWPVLTRPPVAGFGVPRDKMTESAQKLGVLLEFVEAY